VRLVGGRVGVVLLGVLAVEAVALQVGDPLSSYNRSSACWSWCTGRILRA
jgi:hypothetical protein